MGESSLARPQVELEPKEHSDYCEEGEARPKSKKKKVAAVSDGVRNL